MSARNKLMPMLFSFRSPKVHPRYSNLLLGTPLILTTIAAAPARGASPAPFPMAGATDVCPDTPLRLTFSAPPVLGNAGKVQVYDAATDAVVAAVDAASPVATQSIGGLPNYRYHAIL